MKSVGVRELKNHLSQYIREVRSGATVQVTDRGVIVAELSPPGRALSDPFTPPGVLLLASRGLATVARPGHTPACYPALRRRGRRRRTVAQLLDDERGSG